MALHSSPLVVPSTVRVCFCGVLSKCPERYWMASATLCSILAAVFGPKSVWLFLGQSFVGILLFESVSNIMLGKHLGCSSIPLTAKFTV